VVHPRGLSSVLSHWKLPDGCYPTGVLEVGLAWGPPSCTSMRVSEIVPQEWSPKSCAPLGFPHGGSQSRSPRVFSKFVIEWRSPMRVPLRLCPKWSHKSNPLRGFPKWVPEEWSPKAVSSNLGFPREVPKIWSPKGCPQIRFSIGWSPRRDSPVVVSQGFPPGGFPTGVLAWVSPSVVPPG
jgi:hypothetical protein